MTAPSLQVYAWAAPIFMITLGVFAVVDLALGVAQAKQLSGGPHDAFLALEYLNIVFYAITLPVASIIFTLIDAACFAFVKGIGCAILSLVGAALLSIGWIVQMGFWTSCEQVAQDWLGFEGSYCPQAGLLVVDTTEGDLQSASQTAKYAFGWLLTAGYLSYMVFATVVIGQARKFERMSAAKQKNVDYS